MTTLIMSTTINQILIIILVFCILLSVAVTYNRYIIEDDFSYETKPLSEFTEEDL